MNTAGKIARKIFHTIIRTHAMKVGDYLERIKYQGSLEPNLQTLRGLVWAHKTAVPYTNVDYVNGKRLGLEVHEMYNKIVISNGGGMCFEINGLFCWLLEKLGYDVNLLTSNFYLKSENRWSALGGHCIPCVRTLIMFSKDINLEKLFLKRSTGILIYFA